MTTQILNIQNQIEKAFPLHERYEMVEAITKGEQILKYNDDKADKKLARELIKPYQTALDEILGQIVFMMGYSLDLGEWNDTKPLQIMLETFPNISETQWYQDKINCVVGMKDFLKL